MSNTPAEVRPIPLRPLPERPLVSVLMPNYNYAKYIGEAIKSVLQQTYPHWELIVCDDGSTDNSCEIVQRYQRKDSRIKLIRKENGGVASALNAAYNKCNGQIICFLDADDLFELDKLSLVVRQFSNRWDFGFLVHPVQQINAEGRFLGTYPLTGKLPAGWIAERLLDKGGVIELPPVSGLCLRREVADVILPINPKFRTNADGVIQRIAPLVTKVLPVKVPLARRRIHQRNITYSAEITLEYVEQQLKIESSLWEEQHSFLNRWAPEAARRLRRYEESLSFRLKTYVIQRLARNKSWRDAWNVLVRDPGFLELSLTRRMLLRISCILPATLFPLYIRAWWASTTTKHVVSMITRLWPSYKQSYI